MSEQKRVRRILSLPRLADQAVRSTLAPPRMTLLLCGLIMALLNGGLTAVLALLGSSLDTTAGSLIALGSMIVWLPVTIAVSVLVTLVLAVHATYREVAGVELGVFSSLAYLFRPRVAATIILMIGPIAVGLVLLIVPGLILAALLALVIPVMVSERIYLIQAVMRSAQLVWSNPEGALRKSPLLRILVLFLVNFALSMLMSLALQLPMQLITQGIVFREALSGVDPSAATLATVNWISLPFTAVSALISVGVYSYLFHSLALFYKDLVERREARDLRQSVRRITKPEPSLSAGGAV